jgi:CD109 antigen
VHGQDTYVALRALIEYTNRKRLRDVSGLTLTVDAVALNGSTRTLHVANDNLALVQSVDVCTQLLYLFIYIYFYIKK